MANEPINARWQADMRPFFAGLEGRPDEGMRRIEEIFIWHEDQRPATRAGLRHTGGEGGAGAVHWQLACRHPIATASLQRRHMGQARSFLESNDMQVHHVPPGAPPAGMRLDVGTLWTLERHSHRASCTLVWLPRAWEMGGDQRRAPAVAALPPSGRGRRHRAGLANQPAPTRLARDGVCAVAGRRLNPEP